VARACAITGCSGVADRRYRSVALLRAYHIWLASLSRRDCCPTHCYAAAATRCCPSAVESALLCAAVASTGRATPRYCACACTRPRWPLSLVSWSRTVALRDVVGPPSTRCPTAHGPAARCSILAAVPPSRRASSAVSPMPVDVTARFWPILARHAKPLSSRVCTRVCFTAISRCRPP
jgi:hypothetical protein